MSTFKELILAKLKENRPNLSESSLRTYSSILVSLNKKLDNDESLEFFDHDSTILEHISGLQKAQSRKTALSALYILTGNKAYQDEMNKNIKEVNDFYKEQKTNPDRIKKLKPYEFILERHEKLKVEFKKNPTVENRQNLIISYLVSGILGDDLPPRRVLDYSEMMLKGYSENDNYIKGGKFYFSKYKTQDRYGQQVVNIPKELNTLINNWKKVNTSNYLLVNEDGNKYTSTSLSKKISRLFDGLTMDMIRSIFLSNYYKDIPKLQIMEDLAYKMGHSINSQLNYYIKKD